MPEGFKAERYPVRNALPTTVEQWRLVKDLAESIERNELPKTERFTAAMVVRALLNVLDSVEIDVNSISTEEELDQAMRAALTGKSAQARVTTPLCAYCGRLGTTRVLDVTRMEPGFLRARIECTACFGIDAPIVGQAELLRFLATC